MTPDRWRRAQEVFIAATERVASARAGYLDEECRGDEELRKEVESLLSSFDASPSSFLESPAIDGVPRSSSTEKQEPRSVAKGTRLGPYEILSPLGAGGMGEVYRAKDERLGREVAIKVLSADLSMDGSRLKRFEKEARSASALNHPNIVTVYDTGSSDGVAWIAMERVDGETLRKVVAGGAVAVKKVLAIATQIADGLARAHEAGIVHRDLKPENLMVTKDGLVKILDFGLAKLSSASSGSDEGSKLPTMSGTTPGVIMGTVGYMSPEQASGTPTDFRSDQFSFGSILYEMVTGRRAFEGKTPIDVLGAILNDEPHPIGAMSPRTPTQLRWTIERCLAKEPRQRYASTDDLARDLATLRDHLSEASGPGASVAAPAKSRRFLISILAVLAVVVAGISGWSVARRSEKAPSAPSFRRLTFRRGLVGNARFAPDGQTVVYDATWQGEKQTLYLTRTESPESKPFEFSGTIESISRSGELAILLAEDNTLATVPMAGGLPRRLVEHLVPESGGADWAPDGKDLLIVRGTGAEQRLEYPIGNVLVPEGVLAARFSPSGETIALLKYLKEEHRTALAIVGRDRKSERILARGFFGWNGVPCWTADGREVWFTSEQQGKSQALWAVDLAGKLRLVMRVPGDLELDDMSRDGRLLMSHIAMQWSLRGLGTGQTKERDLSWLDEAYLSDLSADGGTLLFTEHGEGVGAATTPLIYVRGTDGSPAVRLGDGFADALSPDKKWVLANVDPGDGKPARRILVPTGPGETKELSKEGLDPGPGPGGHGAFAPDSRRIVFGAKGTDGKSRIYVQDVPDGKPRAISGDDSDIQYFASPVSPDGRFVVGVHGSPPQVPQLYALDGRGEPRAIPGILPRDHVIQWTPDSRSVFVHKYQDRKIWLLDVATGQRRLWKELPLDDSFFRLVVRITPDGKSYVYSGVNIICDLYLVEGVR